MKKVLLTCIALSLAMPMYASAKDKKLKFPLQPFLSSEKAKQALFDVPVYFAGQVHAEPERKGGEVTTSRKTNSFGKADKKACEWVLLSALKVLQKRALDNGMNAVVNIKSNYKHEEFASSEEFECGTGAIMNGVALKGDLVHLPD